MKLRNKETGEHGDYQVVSAGYLIVVRDLASNETWQYDCLAGFNDKWEDYKPIEPLIKDERIRKAVKAWAEANDIKDGITYLDYGEFRSYLNTTIDFAILVDEHRFDLLKKGEDYTIAELCGEEEE